MAHRRVEPGPTARDRAGPGQRFDHRQGGLAVEGGELAVQRGRLEQLAGRLERVLRQNPSPRSAVIPVSARNGETNDELNRPWWQAAS